MAKLKQALPTLVGQTQTAQRNVHPVRMPDPYEGLADSLGNMFKGGMQLGGAIGSIMEERNELDYRRTFNDAVAEVDARMQKEVYEKTGVGAEGATERTLAIYGEVFGKYSGKLSGRNKQRFEEAWGSRRNGQMPTVMQFEHKNLTGAKLALNKTTMENGIAHYASTGADADLAPAVEAFNSTYRVQNGGRLITADSLAKFDADIKDGDGFVTLPDGKKLRIGTDITQEEVGKIRGKMAAASEHYEAAKQQMIDTAHAAVVDRYLNAGDYDSAEKYIKTTTLPMSKGARSALSSAVERKSAVSDDFSFAQQKIGEIGALGGRYGSAKQESAYTQARKAVEADSSLSPERKRRRLSNLAMQYKTLTEAQKQNVSRDASSMIASFDSKGLSPVQQAELIAQMPDTPAKAALQKALDRHTKLSDKPEVRKAVAMIAGGMADGKVIELDGVRYNTGDVQELRALAYAAGVPDKNKAELLEALTNVPVRQAAGALADLLGIPTDDDDRGSIALKRYPTLIQDLRLLGVDRNTKPEEIKRMVTTLLTQNANNSNDWWADTSDDLADYLEEDDLDEELYFTYPQMREALTLFTRKMKNGRLTAEETDFSYQEIVDFAKKRGFTAYRRKDGETVWYLHPRSK